MKTRETSIVRTSRFPIDRFDSFVKLGGRSELPFADRSPDDGDTDNARC